MKKKNSGLMRCVIIIVFACMIANASFAETVNYTYDDLNRLIRAEYGNGLIIEYAYDEVGNRIQHIINNPNDTIPPTTAASPPGGIYNTSQSVILTCSDAGSGCGKIYYTTDGSTLTTSSSVYSSPITISATTTLFVGSSLRLEPKYFVSGEYEFYGAGYKPVPAKSKIKSCKCRVRSPNAPNKDVI